METKPYSVFGEEWLIRKDDEVNLLVSKCKGCGSQWFPQKEICPTCFSQEREIVPLEGEGEIYSYTTLTVTSKRFQAPLNIAYVDYPGDVRVCGQIVGDDIQIGKKAKLIFDKIAQEKDGTDVFSYKFKVE